MATVLAVATAVLVAGVFIAAPAKHDSRPTSTSELPQQAVISILGDSYSAGARASSPGKTFPSQVCLALHAVCRIDAEMGTGFTSTLDGKTSTFADRLRRRAFDPGTQLLIIQGGLSDTAATAAQEETAAKTAIEVAKFSYPKARIMVLGPVLAPRYSRQRLLSTRGAIAAAARNAGVEFTDPVVGRWIADVGMFDSDQVHLNDAGYSLYARQLLRAIQSKPIP